MSRRSAVAILFFVNNAIAFIVIWILIVYSSFSSPLFHPLMGKVEDDGFAIGWAEHIDIALAIG